MRLNWGCKYVVYETEYLVELNIFSLVSDFLSYSVSG